MYREILIVVRKVNADKGIGKSSICLFPVQTIAWYTMLRAPSYNESVSADEAAVKRNDVNSVSGQTELLCTMFRSGRSFDRSGQKDWDC